jgi:hypothetical protein
VSQTATAAFLLVAGCSEGAPPNSALQPTAGRAIHEVPRKRCSRKSIYSILHNLARKGAEEGPFARLGIQGSSQYLGGVHKDAVKANYVPYIPHLTFPREPLE